MDFGRRKSIEEGPGNFQLVDLEEDTIQLKQVDLKSEQGKLDPKKLISEKKENQLFFCICVDGSSHSEFAFDVVTSNFLSKESRIFLVHIYNTQQDQFYNYNNKKDTVLSVFKSKVIPYKSQSQFIAEDRVSKIHALEQVAKLCKAYNTDILVMGYYGIKGPKGDTKELTKGIDFLLGNSLRPLMIIQNEVYRKSSQTGGFNWLFVIDKFYGNHCIKVLTKFLLFLDPKNDYIQCNGYIPTNISYDDVEQQCNEIAEKSGFLNYKYEKDTYQQIQGIGKVVSDYVNFGKINYDFVVIFNNPERYKANKEKSDVTYILTKCKANICVTQNY